MPDTTAHEKDLGVFIDILINYFSHSFNEEPDVGIPYIKTDEEQIILEYSGIIGISGEKKGCVYVTTPKDLLADMLKEIGETEFTSEILTDMVGEIANTISGNARKIFGSNFMISVPVSISGKPESIKMPENTSTFVVPITWRNHKFYLVLCLE